MLELVVHLANGKSICVGEGSEHVWGGYVRVTDANGKELGYWDKQEWKDHPECVMGAIFVLASK